MQTIFFNAHKCRYLLGLCLALSVPGAVAADGARPPKWDLAQVVEQVCLKDGVAHDSVKYCHSCRAKGGDATRWTFQLMCDGRPKAVIAVSILGCGQGSGSAAEQKRQHQQNALADLPVGPTPCSPDAAPSPLFM